MRRLCSPGIIRMFFLLWNKQVDLVEEVVRCFIISLCKPDIDFVRLFHIVVYIAASSQPLKVAYCTSKKAMYSPPLRMHNPTPTGTKIPLFLVQVFHITFIISRISRQKRSPTLQCTRWKRYDPTIYLSLKIPDSLESSENGTCNEMPLVS
jgi:hypothetical protein